MEKIVYLLEDSKILDLERVEGFYDEKRMVNVVFKKGEKIPLVSSDQVLLTQTKSLKFPGDDEDEDQF